MLLRLLLVFMVDYTYAQEAKPPPHPLYAELDAVSKSDQTALEFWHYATSPADSQFIAQTIEAKSEFTKLSLPFCQLTDKTSIPILNALAQRHDLTYLDLRYNELSKNSADALALITLNNPGLQVLNLTGNFFAADELVDVISNLRLNTNLEAFELQGVPLSKKTVTKLIEVIPTLTGLKTLNLTFTNPPLDLRLSLLAAIGSVSSLEKLSLGYSNWLGTGSDFVHLFKKLPTLKSVNLVQCQFYREDLDQISQALSNPAAKSKFPKRQGNAHKIITTIII